MQEKKELLVPINVVHSSALLKGHVVSTDGLQDCVCLIVFNKEKMYLHFAHIPPATITKWNSDSITLDGVFTSINPSKNDKIFIIGGDNFTEFNQAENLMNKLKEDKYDVTFISNQYGKSISVEAYIDVEGNIKVVTKSENIANKYKCTDPELYRIEMEKGKGTSVYLRKLIEFNKKIEETMNNLHTDSSDDENRSSAKNSSISQKLGVREGIIE